jgi:hypothetical protein
MLSKGSCFINGRHSGPLSSARAPCEAVLIDCPVGHRRSIVRQRGAINMNFSLEMMWTMCKHATRTRTGVQQNRVVYAAPRALLEILQVPQAFTGNREFSPRNTSYHFSLHTWGNRSHRTNACHVPRWTLTGVPHPVQASHSCASGGHHSCSALPVDLGCPPPSMACSP